MKRRKNWKTSGPVISIYISDTYRISCLCSSKNIMEEENSSHDDVVIRKLRKDIERKDKAFVKLGFKNIGGTYIING